MDASLAYFHQDGPEPGEFDRHVCPGRRAVKTRVAAGRYDITGTQAPAGSRPIVDQPEQRYERIDQRMATPSLVHHGRLIGGRYRQPEWHGVEVE